MPTIDKRIEAMRTDLFYAKTYRDRAHALGHLGSLLRCETPGTVEEVRVRGRRWWHLPRPGNSIVRAPEEIVLTDDERREFRDWCEDRARGLAKRADEIEHRYAAAPSEEVR